MKRNKCYLFLFTLISLLLIHCQISRTDTNHSGNNTQTYQDSYEIKRIVINWLNLHQEVTSAIKWCNEPGFYMPSEADKMNWYEWTDSMKNDFYNKFVEIWNWGRTMKDQLMSQDYWVALLGIISAPNVLDTDFPDPPTNLAEKISDDNFISYIALSPEDTWNIYINYLAISLVAEIQNWYNWSVLDYDTLELNLLYDSSYWFRKGNVSGNYTNYRGEISNDHGDLKRENNLAQSTPSPPRWTYWYLDREGIIGTTRLESISNLIEWLYDVEHFYSNTISFNTCENYWQYRGSPPVTLVIKGTICTDPSTPVPPPPICYEGRRHWTAGCHGTAGFIQIVLRVLNIPVQIIRLCGHSQLRFITEELYLDHGDTPYFNSHECDGGLRIPRSVDGSEYLIDRATYDSWFGVFPETDNSYVYANTINLGRRAGELIDIYGGE